MKTEEFEDLLSLDEEGYDIFSTNEALADLSLSPTGKDIKQKIKDTIEKHDVDDIGQGTVNMVKMRGYDRQIVSRVTSNIKALFSSSHHSDIIKTKVGVPVVAGGALAANFYTQHWSGVKSGALFSFTIVYNPNGAILVLFREQPMSFFKYPIEVICKSLDWCDAGSELTFNSKSINSKGLDGAEIFNNRLYDKIENLLQTKYPNIKYKRTKTHIAFK